MIELNVIIVIIASHFIGDFVLQSNWMATNKSKNIIALSSHVATYSFTLLVSMFLAFKIPIEIVFFWTFVNMVLHFLTDMITSKITTVLYQEKRMHDFFVVIGADQLFHYSCLFISYVYLIGKFQMF